MITWDTQGKVGTDSFQRHMVNCWSITSPGYPFSPRLAGLSSFLKDRWGFNIFYIALQGWPSIYNRVVTCSWTSIKLLRAILRLHFPWLDCELQEIWSCLPTGKKWCNLSLFPQFIFFCLALAIYKSKERAYLFHLSLLTFKLHYWKLVIIISSLCSPG